MDKAREAQKSKQLNHRNFKEELLVDVLRPHATNPSASKENEGTLKLMGHRYGRAGADTGNRTEPRELDRRRVSTKDSEGLLIRRLRVAARKGE